MTSRSEHASSGESFLYRNKVRSSPRGHENRILKAYGNTDVGMCPGG